MKQKLPKKEQESLKVNLIAEVKRKALFHMFLYQDLLEKVQAQVKQKIPEV